MISGLHNLSFENPVISYVLYIKTITKQNAQSPQYKEGLSILLHVHHQTLM